MDAAPVPLSRDGQLLFLESLPAINAVLQAVCRRFRCSADEADDFVAHAYLKFVEDDYAILRKYGGRCAMRTYLAVVVQRQFLDYRRQRWGSWRPSTVARRLGPAAVILDTLLHRDRVGLEEAIERLRRNTLVSESPAQLRELAGCLPAHFSRIVVGEEALAEVATGGGAAELAMASERHVRRKTLGQALTAAMAGLGDQDRLILRLRFHDGLTVARIAHMLGLEAKPLYRRLDRILMSMRPELERKGVAAADVAGDDLWTGDDGP